MKISQPLIALAAMSGAMQPTLAADTELRAQTRVSDVAGSAAIAAPATIAEAAAVVRFWRDAGPGLWFAKDAAFDRRFRERFASLYETAARGALAEWLATPDCALALVVLLDQYPRNAFRETPSMYATDRLACEVASAAIAVGHDRAVAADLAQFFYLPYAHSEDLADQERSVALARRLGQPSLSHAEGHRDIIQRFGRFPHRNPILGRPMRPEEQRFLDEGGFAG